MCVCIYIYIYIYTHIYLYLYLYIYIYIYICTYVFNPGWQGRGSSTRCTWKGPASCSGDRIHIYIYIHIYTHTYIYLSLFSILFIFVCIHIFISIIIIIIISSSSLSYLVVVVVVVVVVLPLTTSRCHLNLRISQGLGPFFQIELLRTGRRCQLWICANRSGCPGLRPVHLLRVFLLRVLESNFPGERLPIQFNRHRNSHPLELRVCLSQTLWNPNS